MVMDDASPDVAIRLKGKPAAAAMVVLIVLFVGLCHIHWRKANGAVTGAEKALRTYLRAEAERNNLPMLLMLTEDGRTGKAENEAAQRAVEEMDLDVRAVGSGYCPFRGLVLKVEVSQAGDQARKQVMYFRTRYHPLTGIWDPMKIWRVSERSYSSLPCKRGFPPSP